MKMPDLDQLIEAERVQLLSDIETARRKGAEASRELAELGPEPNLESYEVAVVMDRDGAAEDLKKATEDRAAWRHACAQLTVTIQASLTGRRRAEVQLNEHYGRHAAYFGQFAEKKTQVAHDAFLAVQEGYRLAELKWAEAQRAWNPIQVGLIAVAQPGIGYVEPVPPLTPENFELIRRGFVAARPRGVEVEQPAIEVIEG